MIVSVRKKKSCQVEEGTEGIEGHRSIVGASCNSEAEGRGWLEVLYKDSSVSVYMGVHNVFHFFHLLNLL